jgi:hypothetical protein
MGANLRIVGYLGQPTYQGVKQKLNRPLGIELLAISKKWFSENFIIIVYHFSRLLLKKFLYGANVKSPVKSNNLTYSFISSY